MFDYAECQYSDGKWTDFRARRDFLDNFAKERQFDPLISDNWYFVTGNDIASAVRIFNSVDSNNYHRFA
jgi:hypothetical protein